VEFHMKDQEKKAIAWDKAIEVYSAHDREGISADVMADEAIARNMAYETADALASTLVPRSPEVKITPKREELADAAEAQEGLIREAFRQGNLEAQMRKAVTLASLHDYSVIKTVWKGRKRRPGYRAIAAKNFFFDPSASTWEDVTYVGEITVRSMAEIRRRTKRRKGQVSYKKSVVDDLHSTHMPDWLDESRTDGLEAETNETLRETLGRRVVVELLILDPDGGPTRFLHLVPGVEQPLLDIRFPHRYMRNPYSLISLEVPVKGIVGTAPYRLIQDLTKQLNQLVSLQAMTAKGSIPTVIVNKAALQNPEKFLEALNSATDPRDTVDIELVGNVPLSDVVMFTQTPGTTIDFVQAIEATEGRIDSTIGLPSFLRGGNSGADFSAEIQLQSHELATRSGARRKVVHDAVTDIALKSLQLYTEKLDHDDPVYVRAAEGEKPMTVTREVAALALFADRDGEPPLALDYSVRVVDEATENPIVRLQAVQPFLGLLIQLSQAGVVDLVPLVTQILRWLGLEKAIPDNPEEAVQQAQMQAQAAAQQEAMGGAPSAGGSPPEQAEVPGVSGAQSGIGSGSGGQPTVNLPATR